VSAVGRQVPVPDELRILDAVEVERLKDAGDLIFEYIVATQIELGHRIPADPEDLPSSLRSEYDDPGSAYSPPGAVFIADLGGCAVGCVALRSTGSDTAEVKRLYVRPAHQRGGIGRALMVHLHEHANRHRLDLVLDVLATRQHVIALYQDLGYTTVPSSAPPAAPLILMKRTAPPGFG
jgi:ribosomal protein S18 acetylase RimI-like enzyme